ncbi:prepilin-type N-terminal cleavage/methylation domain-containing protein [Ruminococcaceae bacterium YRB3002]|nr:prepilin-type N-terminal cleavage/methylation domain-containing protein [Ruminococcaceae bacterium YRB3002]
MRKVTNKRGFTLTEMVLVIAIIVILAGAVSVGIAIDLKRYRDYLDDMSDRDGFWELEARNTVKGLFGAPVSADAPSSETTEAAAKANLNSSYDKDCEIYGKSNIRVWKDEDGNVIAYQINLSAEEKAAKLEEYYQKHPELRPETNNNNNNSNNNNNNNNTNNNNNQSTTTSAAATSAPPTTTPSETPTGGNADGSSCIPQGASTISGTVGGGGDTALGSFNVSNGGEPIRKATITFYNDYISGWKEDIQVDGGWMYSIKRDGNTFTITYTGSNNSWDQPMTDLKIKNVHYNDSRGNDGSGNDIQLGYVVSYN